MKHLKMFSLIAVAAMALTALSAGSAAATTLEVGGVAKNSAVTLEVSNKPEGGVAWLKTDLTPLNLCTNTALKVTTSTFTGATVSGPVSTLSLASCERPVTVHKAGSLSIANISGTTDGTVTSSGTEVTVGSIFGTLNCKTGNGVDIGRLTGKASGHSEIDIKAVLDCGFLVPSALWGGTYVVTSPTGTGVVA